MASIMKSLAIAAGAGVAIGICTTANGRRTPRIEPIRRNEGSRHEVGRNEVSSDSLIDIEPLLSRLEAMERRFDAAYSAKPAGNVAELVRRIDAQDAELERLRELVDTRANAIQAQLEAEMEQRHQRSFAALEQTIELAISERIAAVERRLTDHGASIDELRERAQDTDANLKRLIVAIEKLVERTQPFVQQPVQASAPTAPPATEPFEAHLNEARRKEEEIAKINSRGGIFSEEEPKKPRFPMARIFGMIALVAVVSGFSQMLG
jgi:hypothetical protein